MSGSPPTRRVIDTLELLANADEPRTIAQIADRLSVSRATMTAILAELDAADWAQRDADLRYRLGPAAHAFAASATPPPDTGPAGPEVEAILAELVDATECGVTLARFTVDRMTVVAKRHSTVRPVPGLGIGQSLSIAYPVGAAAMAWRDDDRDAWAERDERADRDAGPGERTAPNAVRRRLLASVRARGVAAYRPDSSDVMLVEVLAELLGAVGPLLIDPSLRRTATRRLAQLSSRALTDDELDADEDQPISYLAAPVFRDGRAEFELQLGVLRSSVPLRVRRELTVALVEAASRISAVITRPAS